MAFITLAGTIQDPNSDMSIGDQVRFTQQSTTGQTLKGAVSVVTVSVLGTYSVNLQYGFVLVEYRPVKSPTFRSLGIKTVNADNTATSIPELLIATVPVSSADLIAFQALLADSVAARDAAVVAQTAAEAAADAVDTFANLQALSPTITGTPFTCQERANAPYILEVIGYVALPGDATFANGRVAKLQINGRVHAENFGLKTDGTDNTAAFAVLKQRTLGGSYRIGVEWGAGDYVFNSAISITSADGPLSTSIRNLNWVGQGGIASDTATRLYFDISTPVDCFVLSSLVGGSISKMCIRSQTQCRTLTLLDAGVVPNLSGSNVVFTDVQWQSNFDPTECFVWIYNTKQIKFDTCWIPVGATDDVTGLRIGDDKANQTSSYQEGAIDNVAIENTIIFSRIDVRNGQEWSVENSTFGSAEYAIITSTGDQRMNSGRVINCNFVFDTEQTAIYQGNFTNSGATGENAGSLVIENCKFREQKTAINITRGYARISSNQFLLRRSGDKGVVINAGAKGVTIDPTNDFTLGYRNDVVTVDDQREGATKGAGVEDVICSSAQLASNFNIPLSSFGDALTTDSLNIRSGAAKVTYHAVIRQGAASGRVRVKMIQVVNGAEIALPMSSTSDLAANEDETFSASRVVFLNQSVGENAVGNGFKLQVQNDAASGTAIVLGTATDSSSIGHTWFNVEYL